MVMISCWLSMVSISLALQISKGGSQPNSPADVNYRKAEYKMTESQKNSKSGWSVADWIFGLSILGFLSLLAIWT